MVRSLFPRFSGTHAWFAASTLALLGSSCSPRESRAAVPPETTQTSSLPAPKPVQAPRPESATPQAPNPESTSTSPAAPAALPAEPAAQPSDVHVTGFELGGALEADGHVSDARTEFTSNETVHLAVLADGAPRTVKLGVVWLGPDAARVGVQESDITLDGPKAVPFALSSAVGLPAGAYKAEIRIDGWLSTTAEFRVH